MKDFSPESEWVLALSTVNCIPLLNNIVELNLKTIYYLINLTYFYIFRISLNIKFHIK